MQTLSYGTNYQLDVSAAQGFRKGKEKYFQSGLDTRTRIEGMSGK
jgi:hypothetical protein